MPRLLLLFAALSSPLLAADRGNAPAELRFEIHATQSLFEPFGNDEALPLSVSSTANAYLTLYQIHPDSGLVILYPQPHHSWRELKADKQYALADLAEDLELVYRDFEGYVYLGAVLTPEPIHLVPWLEQAFAEKGIKAGEKPAMAFENDLEKTVEEIEADVRFRMGEAQSSAFALVPLLIKERWKIVARDWIEASRAQRYFFAGGYHFLAPEPRPHFPNSLLRTPLPQGSPRPGLNPAAPPTKKERPNNVKPPL